MENVINIDDLRLPPFQDMPKGGSTKIHGDISNINRQLTNIHGDFNNLKLKFNQDSQGG